MKHDISGYRLTSRVALGEKAKIFLQSIKDPEDVSVLDLDGVVGYFDSARQSDPVACLCINDKGGSYNIDLSLRLRRPEIADYPEVLIFKDECCVDSVFRAAAKSANFQQLDKSDI